MKVHDKHVEKSKCEICYRVMHSENLSRHMKVHHKHVEKSSYNPPNMEDEVLLKSMLKCDREYKEKMDTGEKMNMNER